jgi:hypothetical protein
MIKVLMYSLVGEGGHTLLLLGVWCGFDPPPTQTHKTYLLSAVGYLK